MLEVANLTKRFGEVTAVDSVSFSVAEGETMVLLGTSGCGKTTTLKMINRLIEPSAGTVQVAGRDVREERPEDLRKGIGYVIQSIGLFPHYTVAQNIATVPRLLHREEEWTMGRTRELLELLGMPPDDFMNRYPEELSGGQQQRVGIARALAADPPLVLLDEPFGGLDPITRRQVQREFRDLENLIHKTMVLVTHDVFEAVELGDKICLMDRGKSQQVGTPKELIFSPANNFVRRFFRANRFQLELKVLRLEDLLPVLPRRPPTDSDHVHIFSEKADLLTALEEIEHSEAGDPHIRIVGDDNRPILETAPEDILSAFYHTRAKMSK